MKTIPIRYRILVVVTLVSLVASLLTGCGGGAKTKATPQSTPVSRPTNTPVPPTPTPVPTVAAEPTPAEAMQFQSLISNVSKLAPVHLASSISTQEGNNLPTVSKFESDVDAAGNHYMKLYDGDAVSAEIYIVDKQMYMGSDGQFMALGGQDADPWAIVAVYGGAFLWMFDKIEDAKLLGREQINGFNTNKYTFQIDSATLGLLGLAAQQGNVMEYEGFAWVEMNAMALVKSQVTIRVKSATGANVSETLAAFDAKRADISPIEKPANAVGP